MSAVGAVLDVPAPPDRGGAPNPSREGRSSLLLRVGDESDRQELFGTVRIGDVCFEMGAEPVLGAGAGDEC
ncbi:hypothetical protein D1O33_17460 [Rhodococcus rhodochrous]|nr:hypothetical protein NJ76_18090 [Rhodococcus sp. IITR03]QHG83542.1 hypothetical protein D1O33_17460 [Rhodococcus rhodochrous]